MIIERSKTLCCLSFLRGAPGSVTYPPEVYTAWYIIEMTGNVGGVDTLRAPIYYGAYNRRSEKRFPSGPVGSEQSDHHSSVYLYLPIALLATVGCPSPLQSHKNIILLSHRFFEKTAPRHLRTAARGVEV
ncbi:unnamed protein product [Macrosiphum euphorbiae]|uniref:Uncharacterized protein n=1 Tax=Macrosiphum euphorbiae TaxID=13131 RepID=A0AAV0WT72_9HEMI|nr:unnamed protein product [Macrosiphum euphorbiae]